MTTIEHLLTILGEEACEIGQMVSKTKRFGLNERYKDGPSNRDRLMAEVNDLVAVVMMLQTLGVLPDFSSHAQILKRVKVREYMNYSRKLKTLSDCKPGKL